MAEDTCMKCGRKVTRDEKGLSKKFINRATQKYFCMTCLAEHLSVSESLLKAKIKQFKDMGCTLFK
ncbi:MAG: hypothetical protein IKT57_00915 [Clostridia bacterium]|nr:hypothetical protein [Clostridia bacterium]